MLNSNGDIHAKIHKALHCASMHLVEDEVLRNKLRLSRRLIQNEMELITCTLKDEIYDVGIVQKSRSAPAPACPEAFECSATQRQYEVFVILPVFNASDEQVVACINSITRNLANYNFCLVLYTNRPLTSLDGLVMNNIMIIEFRRSSFSLPFAYNSCVDYLRKEFNVRDEVIIFMDDDAAILDGQEAQIQQNIASLQQNEFLAISGHYYDNRAPENLFQHAINYTNCIEFASRCDKPYCHGGAVLMMKANTYPLHGLPPEGLGGISLSVLLINGAGETCFRDSGWFLRNTPQLQVFHPRKQNLVQWTATYLSYEIAWRKALSWLDAPRRALWQKKLKQTSDLRKQLLVNDINEGGIAGRHALTNLLLTKYYKPILGNYFLYNDFKSLDLKTHQNLQEANVG